jgi:hypothetical protein
MTICEQYQQEFGASAPLFERARAVPHWTKVSLAGGSSALDNPVLRVMEATSLGRA